jgi:hypothetical protein
MRRGKRAITRIQVYPDQYRLSITPGKRRYLAFTHVRDGDGAGLVDGLPRASQEVNRQS